jgi:hypothetical protein
MRVASVGDAEAWIGRSIMLETPTGLAFRSITSAAEAPGEHRLALSTSLGVALSTTTPVHLMTLVRSDTDRIEVRHGPVASAVSLPVLEVPA